MLKIKYFYMIKKKKVSNKIKFPLYFIIYYFSKY